uniref:Uncharacterized protein n=1 Tax=Anguilla anguilla TaxID=7936 RepID=A0A0E9QXV1_ANGAN
MSLISSLNSNSICPLVALRRFHMMIRVPAKPLMILSSRSNCSSV